MTISKPIWTPPAYDRFPQWCFDFDHDAEWVRWDARDLRVDGCI